MSVPSDMAFIAIKSSAVIVIKYLLFQGSPM
nr:MAG TPA: hypothetical protein [Caudoviricetes sp.]